MGLTRVESLKKDMDLLIDNLRYATRSSENDFYTSEIYGIDKDTGEFGGIIESYFLCDPTYRDNINTAVENFKNNTGREVYIDSSYLGADVDTDKITVALGINGIDDYYKFKEVLKENRKEL